jgi:hypothetical protein
LPVLEDFVALAGINANTEWSADMIEDDCAVRKSAGEISEFRYLRVINPGIEGKPVTRKARGSCESA